MLGDHLPVEINEDLCISTHHPLVLLTCVQLATVNASAQQCGTLVLTISRAYRSSTAAKERLQFLHEEFACQLVSLVYQIV
jgi:hypothetical protein